MKIEKKLISVIVPVYKVEKYLKKCIDSIIKQSYSNLEIILVDDGSPDDCGKICDDYAKIDNRIKVFHKKNGGTSAARNDGIKIATGEYIGFIDSDDYIEPTFYETLINNLEMHNADMSIIGFYDEHIGKKTYIQDNEYIVKYTKEDMFTKIFSSRDVNYFPWNKLFKRDIIVKNKLEFDPRIYLGEDLLFNIQYINVMNDAAILSNKQLYHYIRRSDSVSADFLNKKTLTFIVYDEIFKIYEYNNISDNIELARKFLAANFKMKFRLKLLMCNDFKLMLTLENNILKYYNRCMKSKNISFRNKIKFFICKNMFNLYLFFLKSKYKNKC